MEIIGSDGIIRVKNGLGDCLWLYEYFKGDDHDYDRGEFNKVPYTDPAVGLQFDGFIDAL